MGRFETLRGRILRAAGGSRAAVYARPRRRHGIRARAAYAALLALVLVEQTSHSRILPVDLFPRRLIYEAIARSTPPDAVVLELPVTKTGHFENLSWWQDQMLASTLHWRKLIVGYSGHASTQSDAVRDEWMMMERGSLAPAQMVNDALKAGVTDFVLDTDLVPPASAAAPAQRAGACLSSARGDRTRVGDFRLSRHASAAR